MALRVVTVGCVLHNGYNMLIQQLPGWAGLGWAGLVSGGIFPAQIIST